MIFNRTHVEHVLYALLMQEVVVSALNWAGVLNSYWIGAAFGAAFFMGREHSQAEDRYISNNGGHRYKTKLPAEFGAILPSSWNADAALDFIYPAAAVALSAYLRCVQF